MNDSVVAEKQQELRKSYNSLMICGKALIAFGAWTALRVILSMLLGDHNLRSFVEANMQSMEVSEEVPVELIMVILFVIVLIICLIAFLINYIAGHGAYVEGKTRKKGTVYIIVTVLLLIITFSAVISPFLPDPQPETPAAATQENEETLVDFGENGDTLGDSGSLLMDFTQLCLCIDVLYSVFKARKLNRELEAASV
ncbi:MAG: hypothetical protein IKS32_07375 [Solobacterium sp.]|nr:hypothetical protein [Solobacterium sp.]